MGDTGREGQACVSSSHDALFIALSLQPIEILLLTSCATINPILPVKYHQLHWHHASPCLVV